MIPKRNRSDSDKEQIHRPSGSTSSCPIPDWERACRRSVWAASVCPGGRSFWLFWWKSRPSGASFPLTLFLLSLVGRAECELWQLKGDRDVFISLEVGSFVCAYKSPFLHFPSARSWGHCQDLVALRSLPTTLREHVDTLVQNCSPVLFFSPAAPGNHSNGCRLCNIAFGMLEKNFLRSNRKST